MKLSEKAMAHKLEYARDMYKRVPLDLKKDKYNDVKRAADNAGETVNGYIKTAIDMRLSADNAEHE